MNGYDCSEEDVLLDTYGPEAAGIEHLSASAGTFSLRRAHYFTGTGEPLLSAEQQLVLTNLIRESVPAAKQKMIAHSLRLLVNIAKRYTNHGLGLFDLVKEGNQGLIHTLEKFEPEVSFRFSTCAIQCICQYIERAIMNQHNRTLTGASTGITPQVPVVSLQRVLLNIGGCHGCLT